MAKADRGLRWRIEAPRELGQRLLLFFGAICVLYIIVGEGCAAGKWRGLLETDCAGRMICERVCSVV